MFFQLPEKQFTELHSEHSVALIILSVIIAIVASYAALAMNKKAYKDNFFHRNLWFFYAAIIMGTGIWTMHFIGMSAHLLPITIEYDWVLTTLSILPAMLASFLAFYTIGSSKLTLRSYTIAGMIMGLGISAMHYIGMIAIKFEGLIVYQPWIFIASILIAIAASVVALYVFSSLREHMENHSIHIGTAIILGLAVSSMHYTGMMASTFYVPFHTQLEAINTGGATPLLLFVLIIGVIVLIGFLIISSLIDKYIKYYTQFYDTLTKLPNRRLFEKDLKSSVSKRTLAIWHLHNLESINQNHGFLFGDQVIQHIAGVLSSIKPPNVQLYRIEGHRFAFLMDDANSTHALHQAMLEVSAILRGPLTIRQKRDVIVPAVCAWQESTDSKNLKNILTDVLAILKHPELQFNHQIVHFDPAIHTHTFEQELLYDVDRAMNDNEFFLVYQPKVNGKTFEVVGVEALLRWQHPTYGFLSPATFIPILEENHKILTVTDWVINEVSRQINQWKDEGYDVKHVAVNIPGSYVTSPRLLKALKKAITTYKLEPHQFYLEITETSFVQSIDEAIKAVTILRNEGFQVSLDDFGTGVSSLSYLKKIPISTLKIDKSFVDEIPGSDKDSSIIQAIISLATSLHLRIVFEGVETEEQVQFLTRTCDNPIIQGYHFAKPMRPSELKGWNKQFQTNKTNLLER